MRRKTLQSLKTLMGLGTSKLRLCRRATKTDIQNWYNKMLRANRFIASTSYRLITKTNNDDGHKRRQISPKSANIKKCARFYKAASKCEVGARNVGACLSTYTCPFINGARTMRWKKKKGKKRFIKWCVRQGLSLSPIADDRMLRTLSLQWVYLSAVSSYHTILIVRV